MTSWVFHFRKILKVLHFLEQHTLRNSNCLLTSDLRTPAIDQIYIITKQSFFHLMGKHKYNLHILKLSPPQSSKIAPMETIQNYIYMLLFVSSDIKKGQKSNIFGSLFKNIRTLSLFEIHYIKYSIVYGTHSPLSTMDQYHFAR